MKLKLLLSVAMISMLFVGCTPSIKRYSPITDTQIKKNIVGTWYRKSSSTTRDGIRIYTSQSETFYKSGLLKSKSYVSFINRKGKVVGKFTLDRRFRWYAKGNRISTKFISCKMRVRKKPRGRQAELFTDIMKLGCRYANKGLKTRVRSRTVSYISRNMLIVAGRIFRKK